MRSANDFEKALSSVYTKILNLREKIDAKYKEYLAIPDSPKFEADENRVEAELDALNSDYRENLKAYREGCALL